jgi:tetratricopeptide (TPR) repeat protein
MPRDDWYRNTEWNSAIESEFFTRLNRARSQRDQYLVIQAGTLASLKPDDALRLLEHYFSTRTDPFHDVRAHDARAQACLAKGDVNGAIEAYKAALERENEFPNFQTNARVDLPYLVARERIDSEFDFALSTLGNAVDDANPFPIYHFKFHAAYALILSAQGKDEDAKSHAEEAIKAAQITKTGLRYHQSLGLVGSKEMAVVKAIYQLGA